MINNTYKVALYIRLSREDGDDLESESITNQRNLLLNYIKANNTLKVIDEYVDDGYSGGNFNRPSFKRLILDIEMKKINCVITKDLSRLGRDYIETGRYIERYFPEHNIRYIAVNDSIDTFIESSSSDLMPFRLGMNDMYAKDISKKVKSTLLALKRSGKYCGSTPPFGYRRDPLDKHHLIIDPDTAPIVKRIFMLYVKGYSSNDIAEMLTKEKIPTPILLMVRHSKGEHPEIWKHTSINNILKNKTYTGSLLQHRSESINYKTKKRKIIPEEEWCVINNAHEAIIDANTFLLAQKIREKANNYSKERRNVSYNLSGLVYCKDCGARMTISFDKKRNRVSMNCNNYRKFSKYKICSSHYMNYDKLEEIICLQIRNLINKYVKKKETFRKIIDEESYDPKGEVVKKLRQIDNKIKVLKRKQDQLYDDKFKGVIDVLTYKHLFTNVELEIKELRLKEKRLKMEKKEMENNYLEEETSNKIIDDFLDFKNPTKEMFLKIIDKIYIDKEKNIDIYYSFKEH